MKKNNGSILIFCLFILSAMMILTEQLVRGVFIGRLFARSMIDREQAEMLALSGINLAIAKLTESDESDKTTKNDVSKNEENKEQEKAEKIEQVGEEVKEESKKDKATKDLLTKLLPSLNRWQTFNLKEQLDGIDGQIKICISCENGKININEIYDFKKQEFKKEYEAILKSLEMKTKDGGALDVFGKLSDFLKTRGKKLDDVTELINIPGLDRVSLFYTPPHDTLDEKKASQPNFSLAIQDLFTIWTNNNKIDPLLCSDSVSAILTLRRPHADDAEKLKEKYKTIIKNFRSTWYKDWEGNWKNVQDILGPIPKFWNEIKGIFIKEFGPKVYSVLSYGKVGEVEQRLLAVIKQTEEADQSTDKKKTEVDKEKEKPGEIQKEAGDKKTKNKSKKFFKIVRIYWL